MRQLLSALSYFSIFFAPFIFPIIVWIASNDRYVALHSKRALLSHLFPLFAGILLFILSLSSQDAGMVFVYLLLFIIVYFGTFVYNVVKGIQVLREYA